MAEGVQKMSRWLKWIFTAGLGITVLSALPAAGAPAWQPTKPVEFVVPAGTGGGADLMARFVSAVLQKNNLAPQNFLVVNKAGGAGAEAFLYVKFTYLPLSGGGQVCATLVGKQIDSTVNNPSECVGHWKAGRVRPLAVLYNERIPLPDWKEIPTMKEAAGKDVSYLMLRGIFAPPAIPKEAEDYYIDLLRRVTQSADWQKYIDDNALKGQFMTGPPFIKWLEEANALHRDLMTKGGLLSPISKR